MVSLSRKYKRIEFAYILILLAIGDKDSSVPIESVYYFKSQFQKAEKANLKVSIYP